MPTTVAVSAPGAEVKRMRFEANRDFQAAEMNVVSGYTLADSELATTVLLARALANEFGSVNNVYRGLKTLTYSGSAPAQITTQSGVIVTPTAVYKIPALTIALTNEAHYGIIEIELVEQDSDQENRKFISVTNGDVSRSTQNSYTRKQWLVNVYEKYETSATMPTVTAGRIKWMEYRKAAAFSTISSITNFLSSSGSNGFETGDIKPSLNEGDETNWVTCETGKVVPSALVDLIAYLRGVSTHTSSLTVTSAEDNGSGLTRLVLSGSPNLKGIEFDTSQRYACFEVLTTDNGSFPAGVYKVMEIDNAAKKITINLAYPSGTFAGTGAVRPFAREDALGGGARTPSPEFVRYFDPAGSVDDVNRLVNTWQDGQVETLSHGLNDPGHSHPAYGHRIATGTGLGEEAVHLQNSNPTAYDASGILAASTGITVDDHAAADSDNPTVTRPPNRSMYMLIKA